MPIEIEGANPQQFSEGTLAYKGSLRTNAPVRLTPVVRPGTIPSAQVARWIDTPLAMLGRHWPSNWAHAVCDDYFPLWRKEGEGGFIRRPLSTRVRPLSQGC